MEQDKKINKMMSPEAIFVITGGTVLSEDGVYHSTSYSDGDAFGTLGGYVRVEAGAILASEYPKAKLVTTGRGGAGKGKPVTHAAVMERELLELGVKPERIVCEEISTTTMSGLAQAFVLAQKHHWKSIIFVTNEFHLPRVQAMWNTLDTSIEAHFISAEDVIVRVRPEFSKTFEDIKATSAYKKRLESEARGIEALRLGTYHAAPPEDKKERLV
ncbi:MAG: YdcF family protein [Patescibacteria group bacterium]